MQVMQILLLVDANGIIKLRLDGLGELAAVLGAVLLVDAVRAHAAAETEALLLAVVETGEDDEDKRDSQEEPRDPRADHWY